jgi:hypothetical protein
MRSDAGFGRARYSGIPETVSENPERAPARALQRVAA